MDPSEPDSHLSRIDTQWTAVFRAHRGPSEEAVRALSEQVRRYGGAVHRYLLASLRNPDAAEELSQEFALRFLRGDFRNADPEKGRFRDFLKRAVYHLMVNHHRAQEAHALPLEDVGEPADLESSIANLDAGFVESWREEMLARTWAALGRYQEAHRPPPVRRAEGPGQPARARFDRAGGAAVRVAREVGQRGMGPRQPASCPRPIHRPAARGGRCDDARSVVGGTRPGADRAGTVRALSHDPEAPRTSP